MSEQFHPPPELDTGGNIAYIPFENNQTNITNLNYVEWSNILTKPTFGAVAFNSEYDSLSNVPFKRNATDDIIYRGHNVGIGLQEGQSPINKLHLIGDLFITENFDTWDFLRFYHNADTAFLDFGGVENGVSFRMNTGTTSYQDNPTMYEVMRFRNNKIGILTNDPQYSLDINGSLRASTIKGDGSNITGLNYNNISNTPNLALKQDTLSNGSLLYGDGSNISNLDYNKITNKPNNQWITSGSNIYYNLGNVGISNINPIGTLTIGNSSVANSDGSLIIAKNSGAGSRHFKLGLDSSFNFVIGDAGNNNVLGTWNKQFAINYGCPVNTFIINEYGDIGIGTNNPYYKLDINGNLKASTINGDGSNISNLDYNKIPNRPDLSTYITTSNANLLNNRFFNNNGNLHGALTDFNNISQFGYNFILGNTNSPNVNSAGNYYSWDIGLGSEYGFNYSAQFALPRDRSNPYLCVRYKNNNVYGGWNKLSSAYADSAGSIDYVNITNKPTIINSKWSSNGTSIYYNDGNVAIGSSSLNNGFSVAKSTTGDGGTNSGSNSCVYIEQLNGWSANQPWALYVKGYTYLDGFRIIGQGDVRNLYKATGNLDFAVGGSGAISFTQNTSTERMRIHTNGNVGIGTITPNYKLDINGSLNALTIYGDGSNISNLDYNKIPNRPNLALKQDTLSNTTLLLGNGSNISNLNYSNIPNRPDLSGYLTTASLASKQDILSNTTLLLGNGSNISNLNYSNIPNRPDLSGYLTTATASSTYATITNLNAKENALIFSSPLTRTTNTISLDLSSYATTSALTTGLATKQATLTFSNPFLNTANTLSLKYDNTKLNVDGSGNLTVIGGTSQWTTTGSNIYYNSGGVSIGTTGSIGALQINREYTATTPDINSHIYCYNPSTSINSFCSVAMRVQNTTGNRGFFSYDVFNSHGWAVGVKGGDATNKGLYFNNGWAFGGTDVLTLLNNGNIGIGTNTPLSSLDIYKSSYSGALLTLDVGTYATTNTAILPRAIGQPLIKLGRNAYTTTIGDYYGIGFGYAPTLADKQCCEIGCFITSTSGSETGDLVFSTRPDTTNTSATERMRINKDGNVGIGNTNPTTYKLHISGSLNATSIYNNGILLANVLFNNNGNNHGGTLTNFNSVSQFGFNYVASAISGITSTYNQFYTLDIGIGAEYGFGSANGTYRAQLAIPRNTNSPYIAIRHQENNTFGGWSKVSAGYADSAGDLSAGTKLIQGSLNLTATNASVYFQGGASSLGYASTAGAYSSSANAGDLVLRSATNQGLILQSGSGGYAIAINTNNNVSFSSILNLPSSWAIIIGTYGGVANTLGLVHNNNAVWYFRGNSGAGSWDISDERTKRNIEDIDNSLDLINQLEPKKYIKLVDRDEIKEYGLIAQDVKNVIPEIVYNEPYYSPDIYEDCEYNNETKIFISTKDQSLILKVGTKIKIILDKKDGENDINNLNSKWCCVDTEILEVIDEFTFKIKEDVDINEDFIFIYGTFKEDFKTLDYKSLHAINIKATQELYKIIQKQEERLKYLEDTIKILIK